jgi:hypothetical protein
MVRLFLRASGMKHRSLKGSSALPATLDELVGYVPRDLVEGARAASSAFRDAGIRHVLVGGLAVGLNGYPRHTRDIDFLVDESAFEFRGPLVIPKPGLPVRYLGIQIDWVLLEPEERAALDPFLLLPVDSEVPVIPVEPLVLMKLVAGRLRDRADVLEMIKAGADVTRLQEFIRNARPGLTKTLEKLVATAIAEDA